MIETRFEAGSGSQPDEYGRILVAVDGSACSNLAADAAVSLAKVGQSTVILGLHSYAAGLHRARFSDMESGLPAEYTESGELVRLKSTHSDLISDGLVTISRAYLRGLAKRAEELGIGYREIVAEGRNYVQIQRLAGVEGADLIVIGASGQGGEAGLGSTAERVLLSSGERDVLVVRRPWELVGRKILTGVDGSENSQAALARAAEIARASGASVRAVSVYDPFFHSEVFRKIASFLPEEARGRFDLSGQERVHREIIDVGLERLYWEGLDRAVSLCRCGGMDIEAEVVQGKVADRLLHCASSDGIGLVVVGRFGRHREGESIIGSNALRLARASPGNILVVAPRPGLGRRWL